MQRNPKTNSTDPIESKVKQRKKGGPRTLLGKQRSKFNAIKHGLYSESLLLPGEPAGEYWKLHRGLHQHFRPIGELETNLVDWLCAQAWRRRRGLLTEREAFRQSSNSSVFSTYKQGITSLAVELCGLIGGIDNEECRKECLSVLEGLASSIQLRGFVQSEDLLALEQVYGDESNSAGALILNYRDCQRVCALHSAVSEEKPVPTPDDCKASFLDLLFKEIERVKTHQREQLGDLGFTLPDPSMMDRIVRYLIALDVEFNRTLTQIEAIQRVRLHQKKGRVLE